MKSEDLIVALAQFSQDPYGFVLFAFPWGEPGELENERIQDWQKELLLDVGRGVRTIDEAIRIATTSGHGIGKSALVAWLILWAMSTFEDTIGVVTANTENQLKTKTWVQLAKWYRMFIGRELFKMTATALFSADPDHEKTWRFDMTPWSERNTEAFAGLHNQGKRILVLFDEASAIPDLIWEVAEGALTDKNTEIIWAVFGNPTRNSGRFRDCFVGGKFAHRWRSRAVDSRSVTFTNQEQIKQWIQDYGEDSDFVRVRVRGVFPRIDNTSFISLSLAQEASRREVPPQSDWPVVLGVDVARFGDDFSVIFPRQGRDAVSRPPRIYSGLDLMTLASQVAGAFNEFKPAMIFVDGGGVGGGLIDRLRQLRLPVYEVQFGSAPSNTNLVNTGVKYFNKRSEIWGGIRDWLPTGAIPSEISGYDRDFVEELAAPTYGLNSQEQIQLETKKEMRRRGVRSPDVADALACTFALPISATMRRGEEELKPYQAPDYNPYAKEYL